MTNMITVGGVETFSTVDYPGQLAAVVFLQGCPWRCPFCYNTDLQTIGTDTGFDWDKFLAFLDRRRGILDAVVFSGGEPLVHNGLGGAVRQVRNKGYRIGLHTGGYRPRQLAEVLPLVDWVGFDIKAPFEAVRYRQATQSEHLEEVQQSLRLLLESGKPFECRTTCDPRILSVEDIYTIARDLQACGVQRYFLQKYRPVPSDTVTTDSDCDKFFTDQALLAFLRDNFAEFDLRK